MLCVGDVGYDCLTSLGELEKLAAKNTEDESDNIVSSSIQQIVRSFTFVSYNPEAYFPSPAS